MTIVCMLIIAAGVSAPAQRPTFVFEQMGPAGALPDANHVMQDRDGLMWMSTRDGLYAYDGETYATYRFHPNDHESLCANHTRMAFEDSRGRLWVAVRGCGVNLADYRKRKFRRLHNDSTFFQLVPDLNVISIIESRDSLIWISGESGLYVVHAPIGGDFNAVPLATLSDSEAPRSEDLRNAMLHRDAKDRIWIGTSHGMFMYDPATRNWKAAGDFPQLDNRQITDIEEDRKGQLWVSCEGTQRFFTWDAATHQFTPRDLQMTLSKGSTIRFCFDADNRLWISEFGNGLYVYDLETDERILYNRENSNMHYLRFVRTVFCDASGNIWVCSDGIVKYAYPKGFHPYKHPYPFDHSASCINLQDDKLWIGYREAGLLHYDLTTNGVHLLSTASPNVATHTNLIFSFGTLDASRVILGQFGSIQVLNVVTGESVIYRKPGPVRYVHKASNGAIWIASFNHLSVIRPGKSVIEDISLPAFMGTPPYSLQTIAEDRRGILWIASDEAGLLSYDPSTHTFNQIRSKSDARGLSWDMQRIIDLDIDAHDQIWLGTDAGLLRLNRDRDAVEVFTYEDGLNNDFIAAVVCVDSTEVWVGTNDGLSRLDVRSGAIVNFGKADGLSNSIYYPRVRARRADGRIYFGGRNGVDFFHPATLRINPYPPKLKMTSVQIEDDSIIYVDKTDLRNGLEFSYKHQFLRLHFAGMHYSAPDKIRYQYTIEGFSDSWIDIGTQRELTLTGLSPGQYVFHLRGWSPDGIVSEQDVRMPFVIAPPFWDTTVFRALATLAIVVLVVFIVRRREQSIHRREEERSRLRKQMLDLEKRALLAQMNPHFIFNAMNSIQEYIFSGDNEGAMRYLTKFSRLLRNVLHVSSHQRIPLSDEIQLIRDYIELEKMRFPDKINYVIETDPALDINTIEISPFLIQPQVENAIIHGILNKGSAGCIHVKMQPFSEKAIRVIIEDNGIGRVMADKLKLANKFKHTGKSTAIVQERLKYNETATGHKAYQIVDLYDKENRACGTRVEMLLTTN